MASPTPPTLSDLVTEGLNQAGIKSPSPDLVSRATNKWAEELKTEIWHRAKKMTPLQITAHGLAQIGQSRYSLPTDYSSDLSMVLLDGDRSGVAQAGGAGSITLAANETLTEGELLGYDILVSANTGQGSLSQVTDYDPTTKMALVTPNFNVAPAAGSSYLVVNREHPIGIDVIQNLDKYKQLGLHRPDRAHLMGDEDYGEFIFNAAPDRAYGIRLRYYANLTRVDLTSTLMSTLYLRWRHIFVGWFAYKALDWGNNDRADAEFTKHRIRMNDLITREIYGTDMSQLQEQVADFS